MEAEQAGRPAQGRLHRGVFVVLIVLAVAAVTRLGWPGLTEFKADEGRLLTAALSMSSGRIALHGISSSVGFPNAPMSVWLYALPLVLWRHPYAPTLFTGILGVAAVAGIYWLARRYWGPPAAVAAALMLAVSPWAILFSRKIWAQNLLPAFAVAWAMAAVLAFVEGRKPYVILHLVALAVMVQIHPAAVGLIPATLIYLLVFRKRVSWSLVAAGGVLAILTAVPFLWYLWNRWRVEGGLPFSSGQTAAQVSFDSFRHLAALATGDGLRPLAATGFSPFPGDPVWRVTWLAIVLCGVGWAGRQVVASRFRRPSSQMAFIALLWVLSPALFFVWHRTPVYIHYLIVTLPALFLLAGGFLSAIVDKSSPRFRGAAWLGLVIITGVQLASWGSLMAAVNRDPSGGFGIPLRVKLAAADAARWQLRQTGAAEVLLAGRGSNPEQDNFPAEFRALLPDVPLRYVDIQAEAVFPATAAIVLIEPVTANEQVAARALYDQIPGPREAVAASADWVYTVQALPAAAAPAPATPLEKPALLANFVQLTGHSALQPNGDLIWDLYWRPADNPDPADYHIFNHLMDGGGRRVAQSDGAAFGGNQWRPGDVIVSRFLMVPTDKLQPPLTMRVGMYRFPSLESVPLLDEAANPAADWVEFAVGE